MKGLYLTKICTICKIKKPTSEFYISKIAGKSIYRMSQCSKCKDAYWLKYRVENKEIIALRQRKYNAANKEKVALRRRKYNKDHRDEIAYTRRMYNSRNKQRIKENSSKYYKLHKQEILEYNRVWRINNKQLCRRYDKVKQLNGVSEMHDWYIKILLSRYSDLAVRDIPRELIELKRAQLTLKRLIKKGSGW